ncbi:MAG TPA: RNA polymerase sigma factor [Azospirillaceae bacterium]|nr:RNA polymerase sigma factor [Azospirillaceae bacterium]
MYALDQPHRDASPGDEPSDDSLLSAVAAGDRDAFRLLAARHTARALTLAERVLGNASDADEVVQEALLRVWRHADRWRPGGPARFSTWFHRIVLNLCLDRRRRPVHAGLEQAPDIPDPAPSAPALISRGQVAAKIAAALAELPPRQRAAVALCYYEDRPASEAAGLLSLSVSALESLLARARRSLRARLAGLPADCIGDDP